MNLEREIKHDDPVVAGLFANVVVYSVNNPCIIAIEQLLTSFWYLRNLPRSSSPDRVGEQVGLGQRFTKLCQEFK